MGYRVISLDIRGTDTLDNHTKSSAKKERGEKRHEEAGTRCLDDISLNIGFPRLLTFVSLKIDQNEPIGDKIKIIYRQPPFFIVSSNKN